MCPVFHVEHLIVYQYAFERPGHVFHMERSVSVAPLREAARYPARKLIPSECSLNLMFRLYASAVAFQIAD